MKQFIRKAGLVTFCLIGNLALPLGLGMLALAFALAAETPFGGGCWCVAIGVNLVTLLAGLGNACDDIVDLVARDEDAEPHGML